MQKLLWWQQRAEFMEHGQWAMLSFKYEKLFLLAFKNNCLDKFKSSWSGGVGTVLSLCQHALWVLTQRPCRSAPLPAPGRAQQDRARRQGRIRSPVCWTCSAPGSGPVRVRYLFCCLSRASLKASLQLQPIAICPFLLKQTLYRLVLVKFMGCWVKH